MKQVAPYVHRDISWLDFNYRVLQESKDNSLPLLERLKFLAIYSSNLDEFFRVRVANNRNLHRTGKKTRKSLDFEPEEVLKKVLNKVNEQQLEFSDILFNQIFPELAKEGIRVIRRNEMTADQKEFIEDFFEDNLLPFVQPVLLIKGKIKPFLTNGSIYLALQLEEKENKETAYAIVNVPSDHFERFLELPLTQEGVQDIILIDDAVRHCVPWIFPGYNIVQSYSIKLTRDAELYIDDEFSGDLLQKIKESLKKRRVGPASRLVYDRDIPADFLDYLSQVFDLTEYDLLPEGRYHNNSDFFKFPYYGKYHLKEIPLKPIHLPILEEGNNIFDRMRESDYLVHPPYHSYESVIKLFETAADDPLVTHIKIIQYRVADNSRIMDALIKSARQGKQVSAFIEVKARFDEESNLIWGERLERAGVKVNYSMPGIKVHAKMASIIRQENGEPFIYSYFSTGNFHEETANIYSDFGLFTADKRLTGESIKIFNFLETKNKEGITFDYLKVGMFGLTQYLIDCIHNEVKNVKAGGKGEIILKMNSLQEPIMIEELYKASQAGVNIKLIVRGICSLVPKVPGISDNISGISIVDRFLEHARVFIFHNNGDPKYYLASADWMNRNLFRRIEVVIPIFDKHIQKEIQDLVDLQFQDNVKSRSLNYNEMNEYKRDPDKLQMRSQMETYLYLKRELI